jgi:hypothetical protein
LRLSYQPRRKLFTLIFATWIAEKTIHRAYAGARDLLRQGDNRPLVDKTPAVFRFVTERTDDEGRRPLSWPNPTDLWNEEPPG